MSKPYRRGGVVGPLILICLGAVFLLHNMGMIAWSVWDVIFTLWPILLIAIGVDILFGRRSAWGSVLAAVLILLVFVGALVLLEPGGSRRGEGVEPIQIGGVDADHADISLDPTIAYLQISAAKSRADYLLEGEIIPQIGEEILSESFSAQDTESVKVWSTGAIVFPFLGGWSGDPSWDMRVHPDVESELRTDLDLGRAELDLGSLSVTRVVSNLGMGQSVVMLPGEGRVDGEMSAGIGDIVIIVPEGMEARIRATTGLGYIDVPDDFTQVGDVYFSPGYEDSENQADFSVDLGIGLIRVE